MTTDPPTFAKASVGTAKIARSEGCPPTCPLEPRRRGSFMRPAFVAVGYYGGIGKEDQTKS